MLSEFDHQRIFFQWCALNEKKYPELKYIFSTLNGVKLPIGLAKKMKLSGLKKGIPDIIFLIPRGEFHGLLIEMKKENGVASKEQKDVLYYLSNIKYKTCICKSYREAINTVEEYLCLKEPKEN